MLELQPAFAGSVGHRLHAAVILIPTAVEYDLRDPLVLGDRGDLLPDIERLLRLLPFAHLDRRHRRERARRGVVHELGGDVLQRAEHDESRTLGRPLHRLAHAQMTANALLGPVLRNSDAAHDYLPPALPALRRICSPTYLTPFPLYGSGGRRLRISAATWPTTSLFAPSTTICVGTGAVSLMPCGARYSIGCEYPSASCSP